MSNPNDPAYPHLELDGDGCPLQQHTGMTIRQQFVMAAMQGLCANPYWGADDTQTPQAAVELSVAHHACRYADAALAEEARTRSKA